MLHNARPVPEISPAMRQVHVVGKRSQRIKDSIAASLSAKCSTNECMTSDPSEPTQLAVGDLYQGSKIRARDVYLSWRIHHFPQLSRFRDY